MRKIRPIDRKELPKVTQEVNDSQDWFPCFGPVHFDYYPLILQIQKSVWALEIPQGPLCLWRGGVGGKGLLRWC